VAPAAGRGLTPAQLAAKREADARSVAVTNVDPRASEPIVVAHFQACGGVRQVSVRPKRGMAFLEFDSQDAVGRALALTGSLLLDRPVHVVRKASLAPAAAAAAPAGVAGAARPWPR
jgi:RNA recognition motif-containing protein